MRECFWFEAHELSKGWTIDLDKSGFFKKKLFRMSLNKCIIAPNFNA